MVILLFHFFLFLFLGGTVPIFTIYSEEGDEQLAVTVGDEITMYYEDTDGLPEEENYISFDTNLAVGE